MRKTTNEEKSRFFLQTILKTMPNIHKKHLKPSQNGKNHSCPIIDIQINRIIESYVYGKESKND